MERHPRSAVGWNADSYFLVEVDGRQRGLSVGMTLEELRGKVSPTLFAILQANAGRLNAGRAMASLTEHFEIEETEFTEEEFGPAFYGASLVNFPKTLKTKTVSKLTGSDKPSIELAPRYNPVRSHSLR